MRVITEQDIIAARQRVAANEAANEQQDFADALLASPDVMPEMVRQLPPYWTEIREEEL